MINILLLVLFWCLILWKDGETVIYVPYVSPAQVNVKVDVDVRYDPYKKEYTYTYTVTNLPDAKQEVDGFEVFFYAPNYEVSSPPGWEVLSGLEVLGLPEIKVVWHAVDIPEEYPQGSLPPWLPPGYDPGCCPPSPHNIKPGQSLSGFSFKSKYPPGQSKFIATGWTLVPSADDPDEIEMQIERDFGEGFIPLPSFDAFFGETLAPVPYLTGEVRIEPEVINKRSKGVITAFVKAPPGYKLEDIDENSLKLDGADVIKTEIANNQFLVAKFETRDLIAIKPGEKVTFTLSGKLKDRTSFIARDTVKVIDIPEKKVKIKTTDEKNQSSYRFLLLNPFREKSKKY